MKEKTSTKDAWTDKQGRKAEVANEGGAKRKKDLEHTKHKEK